MYNVIRKRLRQCHTGDYLQLFKILEYLTLNATLFSKNWVKMVQIRVHAQLRKG